MFSKILGQKLENYCRFSFLNFRIFAMYCFRDNLRISNKISVIRKNKVLKFSPAKENVQQKLGAVGRFQ
jgi:hypothetical protein